MKAVVMAGGEGSRLRPMTANLPKPLLPVANRPVMEHVLRLLRRHGVTETVVTVQFLASLFSFGILLACTFAQLAVIRLRGKRRASHNVNDPHPQPSSRMR